MRRALSIVLCLVLGHATAGALFWAFVNVPESNVAMLALSAALALLIVVALGWTEATALLAWRPELALREAARRGLRAIPFFVMALMLFGVAWWLTARADGWLDARAGEIDAWLMATAGTTATAWAHRTLDVLLFAVRYVVGVSLAVALLAAGARKGWAGLRGFASARAGLSRRQIGLVGAAITLFVFLPLQAVYWRPETLPPNAIEIAFAAAKLGSIALVVNAGWALVLWAGSDR